MTEKTIRELLRESADGVPAPNMAATTGVRARWVRRRRQAVGAALVATAAVAVVLGIRGDLMANRVDAPATPSGPTASPSPDAPTPPGDNGNDEPTVDPAVVEDAWDPQRWDGLAWADQPLPRSLDPATVEATALSTDPVGRALVAVQLSSEEGADVYIYGDDGRWRVLDSFDIEEAGDANGYGGPALRPSSLAPDGTRLAFPQPYGVLVVDLTSATARRYDVPGLQQSVVWASDGEHVVVSSEGPEDGTLVDLRDGSIDRVPFHALRTAYAPDGTAIEMWSAPTGPAEAEMRRFAASGERRDVPIAIQPAYGFYTTMAFAGDGVVAVLDEVNSWTVPREAEDWPGMVVLDASTGEALAKLPVEHNGLLYGSSPLGWLDPTTLLVRFDGYVMAWEYTTRTLQRVGEFPLSQQVAYAGSG